MAQDLFTSLRNYASKLSGGEKSATEMAAAFKGWLEESGDLIKERIESEIDAAAIRRGFIRHEDLEEILQKLADLENRSTPKAGAKPARKKSAAPSKKSAAPKKASSKNRAPAKPMTKQAIVKSSVKKTAAKKVAAKKKSA